MNTATQFVSAASIETKKIYCRRKYKIYLIFTALVIAGGAMLHYIPGNLLKFSMENYNYIVLSMLNHILAPIAVFMLVSDTMAGEIESEQIKILLTRPIARRMFLFAKIASVLHYVFCLYSISYVLSTVLAAGAAGFSSISFAGAVISYLIGLMPIVALITFAFLISIVTGSSTASFSLCLIGYILFLLSGTIFTNAAPFLFTNYMNIGSLLIGSAIPITNLLTGIGIITGYSLVFLSLSTLGLEAREF